MGFEKLEGQWKGEGELWLDPLGNEAATCEVSATCDGTTFDYTWSHDGTAHSGAFAPQDGGLRWSDSFHQPDGADCPSVADAWGLIVVQHEYTMAGYGTWGWRTSFCQRPDESLVIQMTNIAPSGEEGRAVRMTLTRA